MTNSELWSAEAADRYDDDYAEMSTPEVLDPALDVLERLAQPGERALELAIGTGRVGVPLHRRGVRVAGIELSAPMAAKVHEKVPPAELPVVVGDMATATAPDVGEYDLVLLVFNTISNLRTQDEQVACFANAARHLRPGGRFVIELWMPQLSRMTPGLDIAPMSIGDGRASFDTYDLATQECVSHHYVTEPDGSTRYSTGRFRYLWPAECNLMARLAGMTLESRWADWHGSPFTSSSPSHVSIWRKN